MRDQIDFQPDYGEKTDNNSIIKVIGVGGGGGNAVKHMYSEGIVGVDFLICNTDQQVLEANQVPSKLVLGDSGLGAGAKPEVAREFAMNSREKIIEFIGKDTKMLFITAGMGKGTGTGAAPVIAEIAQEMGILTIGVVTFPFNFEGKVRAQYAEEGIDELKKHVDSLIVVKNQNILKIYSDETMEAAFGFADDVLKNAVKCIAELITVKADQNIDFRDIETVMKNSGPAMLGLATARGENRIENVVKEALSCPLLDENLITNAKNFLFFISYGKEAPLKISELDQLTEHFENFKSSTSDVIWGRAMDETLGDAIKLSVIITNYKVSEKPKIQELEKNNAEQLEIGERQKDAILVDPSVTEAIREQPVRRDTEERKEMPLWNEKFPHENTVPGREYNTPSFPDDDSSGLGEIIQSGYAYASQNNQGYTAAVQSTQIGEFNNSKYENNDAFAELTEIPAIERLRMKDQSKLQTETLQNPFLFGPDNDINALFKDTPD